MRIEGNMGTVLDSQIRPHEDTASVVYSDSDVDAGDGVDRPRSGPLTIKCPAGKHPEIVLQDDRSITVTCEDDSKKPRGGKKVPRPKTVR